MIYDKPTNRLITRSGKSVVSSETLALRIALGYDTSHLVTPESEDTEKFEYKTGKSIKFMEEHDNPPEPKEQTEGYQEKVDYILEAVRESDRFSGDEKELNRLDEEMEYFFKTGNIHFVYDVLKLIERFKKEDTLWGVGRGSSCASFLMYVLGINDVNPLIYNISFTEMTKE